MALLQSRQSMRSAGAAGLRERVRVKPVSSRVAYKLRATAVESTETETAAPVVEAPAPVVEAAAPATPKGFLDAVMLQGFGWDSCQKGGWYKNLQSKIPDFQAWGITHIWLPPPSQSVSPQGYMPGQLYNLNSKYGNKEELIELNKALKAAGIASIADIVINHRCADEQIDGVWNKFRDDVTHTNKKVDWGKWAITGNDPNFRGTGNPDTGDDYGPAPDLDHLNDDLRAALKEWLGWLNTDIGFDAWRLDFVKGYGARFIKEYVDATVGGDALNVGEFWTDMRWNGGDLDHNQDGARQTIVNWIDGTERRSTAFDFPTKGILQEAAKNCQYWRLRDSQGRAPGVLGIWPGRAVTFVDNHDTGSTQQHWPFPAHEIAVGYAYILTHPGVPCIFWDHLYTWGNDVKNMVTTLIEVRKRNGINAKSSLNIMCADHDMYVAKIDDKLIVKLGPKFDMGGLAPKKEEGWQQAAAGHNFCVWEKK